MSAPDQPDFTLPTLGPISQASRLEWRSMISNNGPTAIMYANNMTNIRGKFFPRQCRGFLRFIEVYCDNTDVAAHTLFVNIAPYIGAGQTYGATIVIPAGSAPAWRPAYFRIMWNYDSLFIWVQSDSDVFGRLGGDRGTPPDYHTTTDGILWIPGAYRFWFRATLAAETSGDVPVSGTINVVEIPSIATRLASGTVSVPDSIGTTILNMPGSGTHVQTQLEFETLVVPAIGIVFYCNLYVDGALVVQVSNRQITQTVAATFGRCAIGEFFQIGDTRMFVRLPLKFRRLLRVDAWQSTGGAIDVTARICANLIA